MAFLSKKQHYLLMILALLLTGPVSAQLKQSFISFQAGTSIPIKGFQDKTLPDGGFAQTGMNVSLEGAWFFLPWLGAGASTGLCIHPVDAGSLGMEKLTSNPFMTDLVIRSNPYLTAYLAAGIFFRVPVFQKLSFTAKALGGVIYGRTPYQLYKAEYYQVGKNWFEVTAAGDFDASFLAGAGFRYDLNERFGFLIQSEFTCNELDYNFLLTDGTIRTDLKTFAFVNLTGGVVFMIGKITP